MQAEIDFNFLQEHGAAYETGGLEVGQLILQVDGNKVEGMHHQVSSKRFDYIAAMNLTLPCL